MRAFLFVFIIFSFFSVFLAFSTGLAICNFIFLFSFILMALMISRIIKSGFIKPEIFLIFIVYSAVVQSIIAFLQFIKQGSLGLQIFGESIIDSSVAGSAKIIVNGIKIMRGYGTFPHPNILAAFLLLGLFSLYYLYLRNTKDHKFVNKNLIITGIFVISLGLIVTFSRTAWVITFLLTFPSLIYLLTIKQYKRQVFSLIKLILIISFVLGFIFYPFIISRIQISLEEQAIRLRLIYNQLGFYLIKNNPEGVGIGNQIFYSIKNGLYEKFDLTKDWQYQPIHNIYLLMASEIGVLGLLAFLIFLAKLVINNWRLKDKILLITNYQLLFSLLLFGFFDHFLWTLLPGQLMLWLVIGILMGILSPHSSTDRTQASGV